jgi:hypothetical protein
MIHLISKHWTYANSQGAFSSYPINPEHDKPAKLTGVIVRWFNGRRDKIKRGKTNDELQKERLTKKKGRRRSNVCLLSWL